MNVGTTAQFEATLQKNAENIAMRMPEDLTIEELLEEREKALILKEQVEAGISVFTDEIMSRLKADNLTGMVVGNKSINKITRTVFDLSLEEAREYGAVITKEQVDTDMLKALAGQGVELQTKQTEYLTIKEIK